ncbi:unnamed protein product, partial [Heterosigma akashiwo]
MAAERSAAAHGIESAAALPRARKADLAAAFQDVGIKHLEQRLRRAMRLCAEER